MEAGPGAAYQQDAVVCLTVPHSPGCYEWERPEGGLTGDCSPFQGAAPDSGLFTLHVSTCIFRLKEKEAGGVWGRLS